MANFSISQSSRTVFPKVSIWLTQELMRSQRLDANKDPMDPLEQVALLGNLSVFFVSFDEIRVLFHNED